MFNIESDEIQFFKQKNEKIKIMSYSYIGLMGAAGTGKTYSMNKINQAYQDQSKLSTYNLDESNLNKGKITHTFFVSPTIDTDQTYQKSNNKNDRINIPFIDSNVISAKQKLLILCQELQKMKTIINLTLQMQEQIRTTLKVQEIQRKLKSGEHRQYYQVFKNIIKQFEWTKMQYTQCLVLQKDCLGDNVDAYIQMFYQQLGLKYNKYWLRRQKIVLLLDDMSGSVVFQTTTESDFYKIIVQSRHLGIWATITCLHSVKILYGPFRQLFTVFLLMNGLKEEHVKDIFEDIGRIRSQDFESKQFVELYNKTIGYFENYYSKEVNINTTFYMLLFNLTP